MNLNTETKVIDTQDGEPGLASTATAPMPTRSIPTTASEIWQESDVPAVEEG